MKLFPVQVGRYGRDKMWIPWEWVAPFEERAQLNHSQTLERLAERGGLGVSELADLLLDRKLTFAPNCEEHHWREVWGYLLTAPLPVPLDLFDQPEDRDGPTRP